MRKGRRAKPDVLPPEPKVGMEVFVDATSCRLRSGVVRERLCSLVLPDVLRSIWRAACEGHTSTFVTADHHDSSLALVMDVLRDALVARGFLCRGSEIELDRRHYTETRLALEVSWRVETR